jgi:uncharacterized protein YjeT (DUF2065 family)
VRMRRHELKALERRFWIALALVVLIGGVVLFLYAYLSQ